MSKWTRFMDMHSGGGSKEPYQYIYIEAPENDAEVIFYNRFGHSPRRVSCTCCGEDYSVREHASLEQATAFDRGCEYAYFRPDGSECEQDEAWKVGRGTMPGYEGRYVERQATRFSWKTYKPLDEYLQSDDVLVIRAGEIKPHERTGEVPEQGYVWKD